MDNANALQRAMEQFQQLSILREIHDTLVGRMRALTRVSEEAEAQEAILRGDRGLDAPSPPSGLRDNGAGSPPRGRGGGGGGARAMAPPFIPSPSAQNRINRFPHPMSPSARATSNGLPLGLGGAVDDSDSENDERLAARDRMMTPPFPSRRNNNNSDGGDGEDGGLIVEMSFDPSQGLTFRPVGRATRDARTGTVRRAGGDGPPLPPPPAMMASDSPGMTGIEALFGSGGFGGGRSPDAEDRPTNMIGARMSAARSFEEEVVLRVLALSLEAAQANQSSAPPKISDEDLNELHKVKVTKSMLEKVTPQCVICHDDIEVGQEKTMLPCTHLFCPECIEEWLQTSRTCPTCRMELVDVKQLYEKHSVFKEEPKPSEAEWRRPVSQGGTGQEQRRPNRLQQALQHSADHHGPTTAGVASPSPQRTNARSVAQTRSGEQPPQQSPQPRWMRNLSDDDSDETLGSNNSNNYAYVVGGGSSSAARRGSNNMRQSRPRPLHQVAREAEMSSSYSSDDEILIGATTRPQRNRGPHRGGGNNNSLNGSQRMGRTREDVQRLRTSQQHDEVIDADEVWRAIGVDRSANNSNNTSTTSPRAGRRAPGNANDATTPQQQRINSESGSPSSVGVRGLLRNRSGNLSNGGTPMATSGSATSSTRPSPSAPRGPSRGGAPNSNGASPAASAVRTTATASTGSATPRGGGRRSSSSSVRRN